LAFSTTIFDFGRLTAKQTLVHRFTSKSISAIPRAKVLMLLGFALCPQELFPTMRTCYLNPGGTSMATNKVTKSFFLASFGWRNSPQELLPAVFTYGLLGSPTMMSFHNPQFIHGNSSHE
jgi:hypothetical protein